MHGDPEREHDALVEVVAAAVESGLLVEATNRHGVWVIELKMGCGDDPEDSLMPRPRSGDCWGFAERDLAWLYWLGLGMPDGAEIRQVFDPAKMFESVYDEGDPEIHEIMDGIGHEASVEERRGGLSVLTGGKV